MLLARLYFSRNRSLSFCVCCMLEWEKTSLPPLLYQATGSDTSTERGVLDRWQPCFPQSSSESARLAKGWHSTQKPGVQGPG